MDHGYQLVTASAFGMRRTHQFNNCVDYNMVPVCIGRHPVSGTMVQEAECFETLDDICKGFWTHVRGAGEGNWEQKVLNGKFVDCVRTGISIDDAQPGPADSVDQYYNHYYFDY